MSFSLRKICAIRRFVFLLMPLSYQLLHLIDFSLLFSGSFYRQDKKESARVCGLREHKESTAAFRLHGQSLAFYRDKKPERKVASHLISCARVQDLEVTTWGRSTSPLTNLIRSEAISLLLETRLSSFSPIVCASSLLRLSLRAKR